MNRPSFFGYPYRYYRYYPQYTNYNNTLSSENNSSNINIPKEDTSSESQNTQSEKRSSRSSPFSFNFDGFTSNDEAIIELFGIKLYLDDLIILGLLYVLYQEEVKDEMLFICLLLLLLS